MKVSFSPLRISWKVQTAFHVGSPAFYVGLRKILWRTKESPTCPCISVTENLLDSRRADAILCCLAFRDKLQCSFLCIIAYSLYVCYVVYMIFFLYSALVTCSDRC